MPTSDQTSFSAPYLSLRAQLPGPARQRRRLLAAAGMALTLPGWPALAQARRTVVVGHLLDRTGAQADLARDYLAGAKVMFDAVNAANGPVRILHVVRDADPDPRRALAQAVSLADSEHAELLFGPGDRLLPALASSTELARRGVQIVAPWSGLALAADNVWFTRADYQTELDAAVQQLRSYGLTSIALALAPDFAAPSLARLEAQTGTRAVPLEGNGEAAAWRIAATRPGAVIVAGDTLAYAGLGRALAAQGWYGFLVGLSSVSATAAREILGSGYNGGMVLTQVAPGPQQATLRVVKEHVARMKQYLDEPPSAATLAGYIGAAWLARALPGARGSGPAELRRALQGRVDVGDFTLDFTHGQRGSQYVTLAVSGAR
ncbi:ABC transporter substrate-binding protein [Cupriavidus lacunae]|uniref:ABC transporter permease n=1 Tax=Cupriavidus lacunae TaxID=2666307 RepID=A0A370N9K4_9BURK|nr:ABC transporter substrate-binding protein [Cupriavidus lacunae]RDK02282.1 ABC transporter permease [Cupriavidus lacunae]